MILVVHILHRNGRHSWQKQGEKREGRGGLQGVRRRVRRRGLEGRGWLSVRESDGYGLCVEYIPGAGRGGLLR